MADRGPDTEACAREPIHLSGAIQPHGYLLSCSIGDWVVRHASANVEGLFELPAESLVGRDLREFITSDVLDPVDSLLPFLAADGSPQGAGAANIGVEAQMCDVGVHVSGGLIHLELEPRVGGPNSGMPTVLAQAMISRVNAGVDMEDFYQRCADQVRELSGYDRVMVYRFRHDDAGEVIAESRDEAMEPYMGLRFPASDIPAQARALYIRNRIRVIPDIGYAPVPIVPGTMANGAPLDLSQHALRSVSPVHLEYLRNMGVQASMSISILVGGRLWGLFACHHREPRLVPLPVRAALDMFGLFVSMRVGSDALERAAAVEESTRGVREALAMRLGSALDIGESLCESIDTVSRTIASDGVALRCDGEWVVEGQAPEPELLSQAFDWAKAQMQLLGPDGIPASDRASEWSTGGAGGIAGVLAIPFGRRDDWILFFRQEQVEQVQWAGDPNKPMVPTDDGVRIAPRRSFATWRETMRGHALPWDEGDRRAAVQLRRLLQEHLWQPLPDESGNVTDMDMFRRRHVLHEQKSRLDQLGALLNGLGHLGDAQTGRIGERIAALEAEIRALMLDQPSGQAGRDFNP